MAGMMKQLLPFHDWLTPVSIPPDESTQHQRLVIALWRGNTALCMGVMYPLPRWIEFVL